MHSFISQMFIEGHFLPVAVLNAECRDRKGINGADPCSQGADQLRSEGPAIDRR